jgi:hypothetical protein
MESTIPIIGSGWWLPEYLWGLDIFGILLHLHEDLGYWGIERSEIILSKTFGWFKVSGIFFPVNLLLLLGYLGS